MLVAAGRCWSKVKPIFPPRRYFTCTVLARAALERAGWRWSRPKSVSAGSLESGTPSTSVLHLRST